MIILGIDPGTARTGYGVVEKTGSECRLLSCGLVETKAGTEGPARLYKIFTEIKKIIKKTKSDAMAVEKLFFNKNVKTALSVGEARGVILLAAAEAGIEIYEYTPLQVKMALTGYGMAEKKQVQDMVKLLLSLREVPKPDDIADAIAIAICHSSSSRLQEIIKGNAC